MAHYDWVHCLQVGGVGHDRQLDGLTVDLLVSSGSQVVLHVS